MKIFFFFIIAIGTLGAAGCAAPPAQSPPAQARLADAFSRAGTMVRAGNLDAAAREYEAARRLARSIEDADGVAAAAINLSIVLQRLGRDAGARDALGEILDRPRQAMPERRVMQAELRRAILELAGGNAATADDWAKRAERRCAGLACDLAPAILNVRAQASLEAREFLQAARLAKAASESARARDNRAETANALRTLGRAQLAQRDPGAAAIALEQALDLDHGVADPRKILADLAELARAHSARGDPAAARGYFERALAVGRALNDTRAVAALEAQMASAAAAPVATPGGLEPVTERK